MTDAVVETLATPDGPFTIIADADGAVLASGWSDDVETVRGRIRPAERPASLAGGSTGAADAVRAFYDGDIAAIDGVTVRQGGTALQLRGWEALRAIAPGAPLSYAEFAELLGEPAGAVRAVAAICARNAAALFVPCHRVLRSDGTLGGFAWGLDVKRALLEREGAPVESTLF